MKHAAEPLQPVQLPEDVPDFDSEEEAAEFWSTHYATAAYIRSAPKPAASLAEKARRRTAARAAQAQP